MYASRFFCVVKSDLPNVHGYADDTQLYLSFQPGLSMSQDNAVKAMEACISDVRSWMINHHLKLVLQILDLWARCEILDCGLIVL